MIKIKTTLPIKLSFLIIILCMICLGSKLAQAQLSFKHIPVEYIVALGDPSANSGTGAETWGLWQQDPGPRGCLLDNFPKLKKTGVADAQWKYDSKDWWLEEHGAIMEKPQFPLPPGAYVVTGGRETTAVLLISPKDNQGHEHWQLSNNTLYDVTHLPCHAARYSPTTSADSCTPDAVNKSVFPVAPGVPMPSVKGCRKKDYAVLFVIGIGVQN